MLYSKNLGIFLFRLVGHNQKVMLVKDILLNKVSSKIMFN